MPTVRYCLHQSYLYLNYISIDILKLKGDVIKAEKKNNYLDI